MLHNIFTYLPMFTALFWAIILLTNKGKGETAKTFLGAWMVLIFILEVTLVFFYEKETLTYLYLDSINAFCSISTFPLYYWYVKLLTDEPKIIWKNLYLLIPGFTVGLFITIIYFLMSKEEQYDYINHFLFKEAPIINRTPLINAQIIMFWVSKFTFFGAVIFTMYQYKRYINNYNHKIANYYSNLNKININWVNKTVNAIMGFAFASVIAFSIGQGLLINNDHFHTLAAIFFSSLIYVFGFYGLNQDYNISNIEVNEDAAKEIEHASLFEQNKKEVKKAFDDLFVTKKLHRKHDLKISDLVTHIGYNRSYISRFINQEFGCSFNEYINKLRIEDAKEMIRTEPNTQLNNLSFACGFSNATTFTRVFKQYENISPSQYKKQFHTKSKAS